MCAMVPSLPQSMYFATSFAVCMCGIGVLGLVCLFERGRKGFLFADGSTGELFYFAHVFLTSRLTPTFNVVFENMHNLISCFGELSILKLNNLTWLNQ